MTEGEKKGRWEQGMENKENKTAEGTFTDHDDHGPHTDEED